MNKEEGTLVLEPVLEDTEKIIYFYLYVQIENVCKWNMKMFLFNINYLLFERKVE